MTFKATAFSASLLAASLFGTPACAIEVNPGDYEQYPINSTIGVLYYQHGSGNEFYGRGAKVSSDAKLDTDVGLIRALHVYEIAPGVTLDPQFILPVGGLGTTGSLAALGSPSGVGDVIFAAPVKIKLDTEFHDIFAIAPYLIAPTGTYDPSRPLNFGANRWQGVLQTAYIKHFTPNWSLDLVGDVSFFSDNPSYRIGTLGVLKQDPLVELQAYLRYRFTPALEVGGGLGSRLGGRQTFQGASLANTLATEYGRIAVAYFPEPTVQVQVELGRDLVVRNGLKQNTFIQLRLAKVFF